MKSQLPFHLPLPLLLSLQSNPWLPLPKASKWPSQAGDQGQGVDGAKDKGKGKETKPLSKAKGAAKAKEATAKAKEAKAKTKEADSKAKDAPAKVKEAEAKTK